MIYAMTCADDNYMGMARFQIETAYKYGKIDRSFLYNILEIDPDFAAKNKEILQAGGSRRKGCYLWKPYFVNKAMENLQDGDYLIYLDAAGACYRKSVSQCIKYMEKKHFNILGSCNEKYRACNWTKRDAFVLMDCDSPKYWNQFQHYAGFLILRKTEEAMSFLKEWLEYCQNYQIISDCPNVMEKDNFEGFEEHRFDQSILSILMVKYNVPYIQRLPIPSFCIYHHSMEKSLPGIVRKRRNFYAERFMGYFLRHDIGGMKFVLKEYLEECYWFQKITRPFTYRRTLYE